MLLMGKGFHKVPSYRANVSKVVKDLQSIDAFNGHFGRTLICQDTVQHKNPRGHSKARSGLGQIGNEKLLSFGYLCCFMLDIDTVLYVQST